MTRITVINPNTSAELTDAIVLAAREVSGAGVTVRGVHPANGVPSVESHAEEAIAAVGVLTRSASSKPTPTRTSSPASATPVSRPPARSRRVRWSA